MSHPQDLSLREQAAAIASGDLDPAELLEATLARIEERNGPLNAVDRDLPGRGRSGCWPRRRNGPLHGLPIGVKDQFTLPWHGPRDGTAARAAARRASRASTGCCATPAPCCPRVTHMAYWGGGLHRRLLRLRPGGQPLEPRALWPAARRAARPARSARGSWRARSGADGGGSIRLPAAYCGVTGIKPTFGRIATDGNIHGYLTLDAAGPFGRDAGDTRLLLGALLGTRAELGRRRGPEGGPRALALLGGPRPRGGARLRRPALGERLVARGPGSAGLRVRANRHRAAPGARGAAVARSRERPARGGAHHARAGQVRAARCPPAPMCAPSAPGPCCAAG